MALVEWIDHLKQDDSITLEELATWRPCKRETVGFVIHEDSNCITLAHDICDNQATYAHCIGKAMVTLIKELR